MKYDLKRRVLGYFNEGAATADEKELSEGPVVSVRIVCTKYQTKWMALTEVSAEEAAVRAHPSEKDITDGKRWRHHHHSPPHDRAPPVQGQHLPARDNAKNMLHK